MGALESTPQPQDPDSAGEADAAIRDAESAAAEARHEAEAALALIATHARDATGDVTVQQVYGTREIPAEKKTNRSPAGLRHAQRAALLSTGPGSSWAVMVWDSGDRYEGEAAKGLPHGLGVYSYSTGDLYMGRWRGGASLPERRAQR